MSSTPEANVRAMHSLCESIEAAIAGGDLPTDAVSDLKAAIDDTRMRVWASMEAARSGDPTWVQEFWLQRAAEVCRTMVAQLERGGIDPSSRHAGDLRAAVLRLAASLAPDSAGGA
jgi:hypothetical protein